MANIFISYSSTDKTIVQSLAKLLISKGWSVWWDREIPIGQNFDLVIEEELNKCDCALVIWTARSVASEWVRAEASEAMKQKKLIPIIYEQVEVPLAFRNMEAALLIDWNGENDHPELELFYNAIEHKIKRKNIIPKEEIYTTNVPKKTSKQRVIALYILLGIFIVSTAIYLYMKNYEANTQGQITIINGKVKTASEMPISKAEINVEGTNHFAISSTDGNYSLKLEAIEPNEEITISVSHPGYEDKFFIYSNQKNQKNNVDIYLNPIKP